MNNSSEIYTEELKESSTTDETKSQSRSSKRLSMSSEGSTSVSENGTSSDDSKHRKGLRSTVITDNEPLKIKLKISKSDIIESYKHRKDCDVKSSRLHRKSELKNGDEKLPEEEPDEKNRDGFSEKKRKLRLRKDNDEGSDDKEERDSASEEKKRKSFKLIEEGQNETSEGQKVMKKRGRHPKIQSEDNHDEGSKRRSKRIETGEGTEDEKTAQPETDEVKDEPVGESFCWTCHKDGSVVKCDTCPRVFHLKCVSLSKDPSKNWICPECSLVLHAETISTRSEVMKSLSLDQLCTLLGFAIERMKNVPESEAFWKPVDPKEVPMYDKYVTNPMDLKLLEKNMKARMYGSPQAFLADAKWLLHNSIIFNSTQSPLTSTARFLVKICRQEMAEIENCPDCYLNAHTKEDWFIEICRKPHILIWARLKGFPFWPAKAMSTNLKTQQVDARFFGAHDKAWVPVKECYLYSKNSPQLINKKRGDLDNAFLEVEGYIQKIKQKFGTFCLAPDRTPFVPEMYDKQLQILIPNYKEEKTPKKKKKLIPQKIEENGVVEKTIQNGKKITEHGAQHRFKLKRPASLTTSTPPVVDDAKIVGDINLLNDFVSEEKVLSDDKISPEDEIARSLEIYDTHKKIEALMSAPDENSTDMDDGTSIPVPIPEHAYSRVAEEVVASTSVDVNQENENVEETSETTEDAADQGESCGDGKEASEISEKTDKTVSESNECNKDVISEESKIEEQKPEAEMEKKAEKVEKEIETIEQEVKEKEKEKEKKKEAKKKEKEVKKKEKKMANKEKRSEKPVEKIKESANEEPEQCKVSSTNAEVDDIHPVITEKEAVSVESNDNSNSASESGMSKSKGKTKRKSVDSSQDIPEKKSNSERSEETPKAEEEKSAKSFTNLTVDQKQKIISEAKLLANIDEMTALGKQKVLNELGLDASQVDIRQLAQENREILETLNKKGHSEEVAQKAVEDVPIKNEDFEQYLMEESNEENDYDDSIPEPPSSIPRLGAIKVRDFNTLSKSRSTGQTNKNCEPMLKIMDIQSLKEIKGSKDNLKRKKSLEDSNSKKLKVEPVIELIKLDNYDKNVQKLNRKLRLSDEVSLLMVDGEKKTNVELDIDSDSNSNSNSNSNFNSNSSFKKLPLKQYGKSAKARKSIPNRTKDSSNSTTEKTSPKNVNVISVDTENSNAQKNLLKSLCLEEKRQDEDKTGNKNKDKNIRIVDIKGSCELNKKQLKDVTIETVKDSSKPSEKDGSCPPQKNVTVVANSHLILTNNGPTFVNQNNQPNLALAQNNLGQLSLVHLTNLTSGIQTNFVNLANETIGFNNSIGTLYASPNFSADGFTAVPNAAGSSVILTSSSSSSSSSPSLTTNAQSSGSGNSSGKPGKVVNESNKIPIPRLGSTKSTSGISVKSPASLGLVTSQSSSRLNLPPLIAKPGEEGIMGEIGSVAAELNRHSVKLAEYMRATIEDILRELSNQGSVEAKYKTMLIEMEKMQWRHQQELMELKHLSERSIMDLQTTLESEKQKALAELKSQLEAQHQKEISETKHKQWCANCGKEALFYCCWNTSYCDYPCQQQHWPGHMSTCAQLGNNIQANNQLQGKGMKYQTATYVPIISRGGTGTHTGGPFAANRAIPSVQILEQSSLTKNMAEESKEVTGEVAYSTVRVVQPGTILVLKN